MPSHLPRQGSCSIWAVMVADFEHGQARGLLRQYPYILLQCPNTHRSPQLLGCMHTQPSSAHLESLALCFLSLAAKAADPAVTLASGKLLDVSGDVTVKPNAAGFPIIQFVARTCTCTSPGHVWPGAHQMQSHTKPPPEHLICRLSPT